MKAIHALAAVLLGCILAAAQSPNTVEVVIRAAQQKSPVRVVAFEPTRSPWTFHPVLQNVSKLPVARIMLAGAVASSRCRQDGTAEVSVIGSSWEDFPLQPGQTKVSPTQVTRPDHALFEGARSPIEVEY